MNDFVVSQSWWYHTNLVHDLHLLFRTQTFAEEVATFTAAGLRCFTRSLRKERCRRNDALVYIVPMSFPSIRLLYKTSLFSIGYHSMIPGLSSWLATINVPSIQTPMLYFLRRKYHLRHLEDFNYCQSLCETLQTSVDLSHPYRHIAINGFTCP